MAPTFPGESQAYRAARDRLLAREIELRQLTEAVARERRALPPGGVVPEDYVFETSVGGASRPVRLSELFAPGKDTLAIYSYMFGPERAGPCSMCTPLLDGLDAAEPNIRQRLTLVAVAESPAARLAAFAAERGWRNLRVLSTAGNHYNRDYHGKGREGGDTTMLNLFRREGAKVRHFWGTEMAHTSGEPGQDHRGLDMLSPIFAMFDLTPAGRGDFYTKLSYP
ncbi:DUF899 family protein [Nannocystis bainbridge]|uniref:DUF899 family protein n=1 Tax=Nannocystis bainbridge TaxID=2995303 RepID=A0ABT5DQS1_9BACT|nr:DUF899 family protein [Nannocystis bainbridge]MDC0716002.1 DUF899 family protein [Nannocystis bainbridge]